MPKRHMVDGSYTRIVRMYRLPRASSAGPFLLFRPRTRLPSFGTKHRHLSPTDEKGTPTLMFNEGCALQYANFKAYYTLSADLVKPDSIPIPFCFAVGIVPGANMHFRGASSGNTESPNRQMARKSFKPRVFRSGDGR